MKDSTLGIGQCFVKCLWGSYVRQNATNRLSLLMAHIPRHVIPINDYLLILVGPN